MSGFSKNVNLPFYNASNFASLQAAVNQTILQKGNLVIPKDFPALPNFGDFTGVTTTSDDMMIFDYRGGMFGIYGKNNVDNSIIQYFTIGMDYAGGNPNFGWIVAHAIRARVNTDLALIVDTHADIWFTTEGDGSIYLATERLVCNSVGGNPTGIWDHNVNPVMEFPYDVAAAWPAGAIKIVHVLTGANGASKHLLIRNNNAASIFAVMSSDALFTVLGVGDDGGIIAQKLPNAAPAGGSKKLWYDPADGNRVKYVP